MAKSGKGLFSTGVDAEQRKRLGVEKVEAEKALRTHQARNVQIQKRLQEAQELRADAIKKRDAFKFRKTRVQVAHPRIAFASFPNMSVLPIPRV